MPVAVESTAVLLAQTREGDAAAADRLMRRYLPLLNRWGHGRLPPPMRGALDTEDLVQSVLTRAMGRLSEFRPEREGAFLAYLRRSLLNAVRDEVRKYRRRPPKADELPDVPQPGPSTVEKVIGSQLMGSYEKALLELGDVQREAVILRIEFGMSFKEVAAAIQAPSPNAARMVVSRALVRLSRSIEA